MTFEEAFSIQLLENLYVAPPKHEEIAAMWRFWRFEKASNPLMTVNEFARQIGRRPEVVRGMLRFCSLPESVQAMNHPDTKGGKASYSLLEQVARRAEAFAAYGKPMSELEVIHLANFLVGKRVKVNDYARQVTEEIAHLHNEQGDLFADMLREPIGKRVIRKVVATEIVHAIIQDIQYLATVNSLMHSGAFGGISPYAEGLQLDTKARYSPDSPAKIVLRFVKALKGIVPDLTEMLRRDSKSGEKLMAALPDLELVAALLSAVLRK